MKNDQDVMIQLMRRAFSKLGVEVNVEIKGNGMMQMQMPGSKDLPEDVVKSTLAAVVKEFDQYKAGNLTPPNKLH